MDSELLVHASGLVALVLNIMASCCRCEIALRRQSVAAGCLWAVNNLLLGAPSAAALSVVSASRTATSTITLRGGKVRRRNLCALFLLVTAGAALLTWQGPLSAITLSVSLLSTYAMFHLSGTALRMTMLAASVGWMASAWTLGSWEQIAANLLTATSACYGAWSCRQANRPA
jgi:hypothetical protein